MRDSARYPQWGMGSHRKYVLMCTRAASILSTVHKLGMLNCGVNENKGELIADINFKKILPKVKIH